MKMYNKEGASCNVAKDQVSLLTDAGWSRKAPDPITELESAETVDESSEVVKTEVKAPKVAKAVKKIIPKRK